MERILTYAEFAKQFDETGEVLGNTEQDVATLMTSTDQFTADSTESPNGDIPVSVEVSTSSDDIIDMATEEDEMPKTEVEIITDEVEEKDTDDSDEDFIKSM